MLLFDGERAGYVCVLPTVMVVYEFGWVLVTGVGNLFVYIFFCRFFLSQKFPSFAVESPP